MELNLLDYCVLAVFIIFIFRGIYKGFLSTAFSIGAFLLSWLLALMFMGVGSRLIRGNETLYNMMLYYTEGSEYISNNVGVEAARLHINQVSSTDLSDIVIRAEVPYPMDKEILANVAKEAFVQDGISTLGDYFNQTMVCVFINIISFFVFFFLFRLLFAFLIEGVDYAWRFPLLRSGDVLLGAALGTLRGMLALFLLFMLMPVLLTIVGQFDLVTDLVDSSFFVPFFYHSNFLLSMIPGV